MMAWCLDPIAMIMAKTAISWSKRDIDREEVWTRMVIQPRPEVDQTDTTLTIAPFLNTLGTASSSRALREGPRFRQLNSEQPTAKSEKEEARDF